MDFKYVLAEALAAALDTKSTEEIDGIAASIEVPPNAEMGDFAFPCFRLSKAWKKAPAAIAEDLSKKIVLPDFICETKPAGPYLNFFLDKNMYAASVISSILQTGADYGKSDMGKGRKIVIDYSSPNIAKPFHVGHLRSTVIGNALYNLMNCIGYQSVGVNHLGDWGTQFGKLIVAFKKWGSEEELAQKGIKELLRIYVLFHDEVEKDPTLDEEARGWLVKMQNSDEEALALWKRFNDISLIEFNHVYEKLNVKFDYYTGESFYNDKMGAVVEELKEKNLLVESQGAMVVDLEPYQMPPCLILRRDGGTLYPTRDISAARYRKETFDFEKCLYLTGLEQNLHFAQWFKVIDLMGYEWAKDLVHIPFGLVSLTTGKLSTRKGNVVFMEDLLNEAVMKTKDIIQEKNPDLENKDLVAEQVGIGAVIFNDLYNSRIKDVTFSWERMLNFEGETGPYVQYTHARAHSVLTKAGVARYENIDFSVLIDEASFDVIKLLHAYPEKIMEAANKYEPFILTRHLVDLAQAFNKFYHDNAVLNTEEPTKLARLSLVYCVKHVLALGLGILGIATPEKM